MRVSSSPSSSGDSLRRHCPIRGRIRRLVGAALDVAEHLGRVALAQEARQLRELALGILDQVFVAQLIELSRIDAGAQAFPTRPARRSSARRRTIRAQPSPCPRRSARRRARRGRGERTWTPRRRAGDDRSGGGRWRRAAAFRCGSSTRSRSLSPARDSSRPHRHAGRAARRSDWSRGTRDRPACRASRRRKDPRPPRAGSRPGTRARARTRCAGGARASTAAASFPSAPSPPRRRAVRRSRALRRGVLGSSSRSQEHSLRRRAPLSRVTRRA